MASLLAGSGLAGRIALDAAALALVVLAVGGITSLYFTASLLQQKTEAALAHEARLNSQRIEMSLNSLLDRLESMADNPLTSNGLTDTGISRDAYLRPFLQNNDIVRRGATLILLDVGGAVVSSSGAASFAGPPPTHEPWFTAVLERRATQVQLLPTKPGMPHRLRLAAPVVYPASQQAEGVLLLEVDLGELLNLSPTQSAADFRQYAQVVSGAEMVAGERPPLALFQIGHPLTLAAPYRPLALSLELGVERWGVLRPLLKLAGAYAVAALLAIAFVLWIVRRISTRLTAPLVALADNADNISRSGRPNIEFVYEQEDEIGRLGRSFSSMLAELGAVQSELEHRVAERTRELRTSEDKLASLLRSLPDIVFSLSADCRSYLYSSAATHRVLGVDGIGPGTSFEAFLELVDASDLAQVNAELDRLRQAGECECVFWINRRDGEQRWLHLRMHAVVDAAGLLVRYDGIATDVTERKLAEEGLRKAEQRWELAMRGTNDGLWDWDLCADRVYFSARWKSMLGYAEHEIADRADEWRERVHPDDLPQALANFERHLRRESELYVTEFRMRCKDGSYKWILSRGRAIWDDAGTPIRATGSHTDITERKRAEEALLTAQQFAQSTLDGLTAHICVLDANGTILSVNEAWRQFGLANGADPCRSVEGMNYLHVCEHQTCTARPDNAMAIGVRDVLAGRREVFESECPCHSPTEQRWFLVRVSRLHGDGPGRVVVAHENITPRKLAENALRASEERWRFALEGAGDGVWDWDAGSGGLILSKRWKEILGYAEHEVGAHYGEWEGRVHPDDLPRVLGALQGHLEDPTVPYLAEYRLLGKLGWKWVLDRGMVVSRDDDGRPLRMLGTISDISPRKAMEAALQDRNAQLDTIFALSPDGFVSFDQGRRLKFANAAFYRMTGIRADEVRNEPEQCLDRRLRALCANGETYPGLDAYFASAADGADGAPRRHFLSLAEPRGTVLEIVGLRSRAQSVSKVLYLRDVTHEIEVDRMKSEFLASAAHELRTPMASIYGFTELLLIDDFDAETRRDVLQTIHQQTDLLVKIINELLDLARIEARRGKDFHLEPVDLVELVRETVGSLQIDAAKWPLEFVLPPTGPCLRGDRNKLRQALVNVIGNAIKYSPDGGAIEIEAECRDAAGGTRELGLHVRDHGIGMTPAQSARIFERFYRADTSGQIPGTGLGMSIVKEIVDLHGGRVEVASSLGQGTEISLWLPVARAAP